MEFEWDPEKDAANREKHGIGFDEARRLWTDRDRLVKDARHPTEHRHTVTGLIGTRFWTAVCTYRDGRTRIISVRRARKREIADYGARES
jgi:hypothetical protein